MIRKQGQNSNQDSEMKRRIKLPTMLSAVLGSAIRIVMVVSVASLPFAGGEAQAAGRRTSQLAKPQVSVPVRYDNEPDAPVVVTEAYLEAGEPREMTLEGLVGDGSKVTLIGKGEKARRIKFISRLLNRSDRTVRQFILKIQNPAFFPDESILVTSGDIKPSGSFKLGPQQVFTFTTSLPITDRKNGLELMSHLSDFRLIIAETLFESGEDREWVQGGDYRNLYGSLQDTIVVNDCEEAKLFEIVKKKPASEQKAQTPSRRGGARLVALTAFACPPRNEGERQKEILVQGGQASAETIYPESPSLRPQILFKGKARYTQDAIDNKVEGTVVLNVVFGADGRVKNVRVVRPLPDGLTEKAIEAAMKVRFQPAMKDGAPVSVRGNLEFNFALER